MQVSFQLFTLGMANPQLVVACADFKQVIYFIEAHCWLTTMKWGYLSQKGWPPLLYVDINLICPDSNTRQ